MTTAAKKTSTAARKKAAPKTLVEVAVGSPVDTPSSPPPAALSLTEEQRTANLIALLALDAQAWSNLYRAGVDDEAVAHLIAHRLGLAGAR